MHIEPQIERVLRDAMRREGWTNGQARLINQASDLGGRTRGGVTAKRWGEYRKLGRPATDAELLAMTEAEALAFYFEDYVIAPHLDWVLDQRLRALLVDWAFTSGPDDPIVALQKTLSKQGIYVGRIDGVIGPRTKAALFSDRDPRTTYRDVLDDRIRFYVRLGFDAQARAFLTAHPTCQLANLSGWINRCLDFI